MITHIFFFFRISPIFRSNQISSGEFFFPGEFFSLRSISKIKSRIIFLLLFFSSSQKCPSPEGRSPLSHFWNAWRLSSRSQIIPRVKRSESFFFLLFPFKETIFCPLLLCFCSVFVQFLVSFVVFCSVFGLVLFKFCSASCLVFASVFCWVCCSVLLLV